MSESKRHTLREETALRQAAAFLNGEDYHWLRSSAIVRTPSLYLSQRGGLDDKDESRFRPGQPCPCSLFPGEYGPQGCQWCLGMGVITDDYIGVPWPWWETDGQGVTRAERHWGGMRSPEDPRQCSILDGDAEAQRRALRDAGL